MTILEGDFVVEEGSNFCLCSQDSLFRSAANSIVSFLLLLHSVTDGVARSPRHHSQMGETTSCWKDHRFKPQLWFLFC